MGKKLKSTSSTNPRNPSQRADQNFFDWNHLRMCGKPDTRLWAAGVRKWAGPGERRLGAEEADAKGRGVRDMGTKKCLSRRNGFATIDIAVCTPNFFWSF